MENKIKLISKVLKDYEVILIDSPSEVYELLESDLSFNSGEYDLNLIIGRRKVYLICDYLIYPFLKNIKNVELVQADNYEYLKNGRIFTNEWHSILKKSKITKVGLVNIQLENYFRDYKTFHFMSPVKTLGRVKSIKELKKIRDISKFAKKIISFTEKSALKGMTDVALRNLIDEEIYRIGCRRYLPTSIGFDSRSIYPTLTGETLTSNKLILLDFGILFKGSGIAYSTTIPFGKLSARKEKIFKIAHSGLEVIKSAIASKVKIDKIDDEYRTYLKAHGLLKYGPEYILSFLSSAGFGEVNSVADKNGLTAGNVIKITSSIFIPDGFGVRMENILLVKEKGYEEII